MLKLRAGCAVAALLLGACSGSPSSDEPSAAQYPAELQESFQQVLKEAQSAFGFPGVQAGVWSPAGQWVGTVGTAGADSTEAITPEDHTRIGSITKTFTVTALLQEVEKGNLSLSDPIEKYVPGLPNGKTATLRDLAQMTSGIPSYTQSKKWLVNYFSDTQNTYTAQQLVDYVKGKKPMFEPGSQFYYSNTNTVALGLAIEKVAGKPLGDVLETQIIEPLGLTGTSWPGESPDLPEPYLSGETEQGLPEGEVKDSTNWNPSWGNAAGEMISTLDDLRAWGVALGTGEGILQPETQQLRIASLDENTAIEGNSPDMVYGIGFGRVDGWIGHTGELPGYNTSVQYDPETQTTIVVMVNSDIPNEDGAAPAPTVLDGLRAELAGQ